MLCGGGLLGRTLAGAFFGFFGHLAGFFLGLFGGQAGFFLGFAGAAFHFVQAGIQSVFGIGGIQPVGGREIDQVHPHQGHLHHQGKSQSENQGCGQNAGIHQAATAAAIAVHEGGDGGQAIAGHSDTKDGGGQPAHKEIARQQGPKDHHADHRDHDVEGQKQQHGGNEALAAYSDDQGQGFFEPAPFPDGWGKQRKPDPQQRSEHRCGHDHQNWVQDKEKQGPNPRNFGQKVTDGTDHGQRRQHQRHHHVKAQKFGDAPQARQKGIHHRARRNILGLVHEQNACARHAGGNQNHGQEPEQPHQPAASRTAEAAA